MNIEQFKVGDIVRVDLEKVFKYTNGRIPNWYSDDIYTIVSIKNDIFNPITGKYHNVGMVVVDKLFPNCITAEIWETYISLDIKEMRKRKLIKILDED